MAYDYPAMAATAQKVSKYLFAKGKTTAKVKVARYNSAIKAVEINDPIINLEGLLKLLSFPGEVTELSPADIQSISGTYKAKLVEIVGPITSAGLTKGEKFFFLNKFTEKGSVQNKALTPSELKLDLRDYTNLDSFDKAVNAGISNLKVPAEVQLAMSELLKNVSNNSTKTDTIPFSSTTKDALEKLKPSDKQAIGKDFGEVLSLRWYLTQPYSEGWTRFGFETGSNAALVDYYVYRKVK